MATSVPVSPSKKTITFNNTVNEHIIDQDPDDNKDNDDNKSDFQTLEDDIDSVFPQIGATIVIDPGTYNTRIGISGETEPSHIVDTTDWLLTSSQSDQLIICGTINDDKNADIVKLWTNLIEQKLTFDVAEHPLVLTEPHNISKVKREKLTEILFEEIQCPAFYISPSSLFSLYSMGRTSGLVLDFAYDCSRIVPIYEGYVLQFNSNNIDFGGQHVSNILANILQTNNKISQINSFNANILEDIKRKYCSVQIDKKKAKKKQIEMYELPDGNQLKLDISSYVKCSEILFKNNQKDKNNDFDFNLIEFIYDSVIKCDKSSYNEMFSNIILCGGTSMLNGFKIRIQNELTKYINHKNKNNNKNKYIVHIAEPPNKQLSAWKGASIFSSLTSFPRALITMKEYEDCGARIVHHKCF